MLKELQTRADYFYVDTNCLLHPECFRVLDLCSDVKDVDKLEKIMFNRIMNYLDFLEQYVNPRKMMYIAIDGSAPLAKISQQRKRRFKTIHETSERNKIKKNFGKSINDIWNNTVITPGTVFMEKLHKFLVKHYESKKSKIEYIYSSYHTAGEGEHKILQHIKKNCNIDDSCNGFQISSKIKDIPATVIYGLDADLIFLAMASKKQNIYLLRESLHFERNTVPQEIKDPEKDVSQQLMYVSIENTIKSYNSEITDILNQRNSSIMNNVNFSNDLIFVCFLLGNDFLPHFPSLDIHKKGLDQIIDCYIECVEQIGSLLIENVKGKIIINNTFFMLLLEKIGKKEFVFFTHVLRKHNNFKHKKPIIKNDYEQAIWEFENLINDTDKDPVMLGYGSPSDWNFRYYDYYFNTSEYQEDTIKDIVFQYLKGIKWVTEYYFDDCPGWKWQYPYDHAPFISDIAKHMKLNKININDIKVLSKSKPIPIMTQLLSVLPPQKNNLLPKNYAFFVEDKKSLIIDMFPKSVVIDTLYKDLYWTCVPKVPYLDIDRIIKIINDVPLTLEEKKRNKILDDFVF